MINDYGNYENSKTDSKETLMLIFQGYFLGILNKNNKITNYDRRTIIEKI